MDEDNYGQDFQEEEEVDVEPKKEQVLPASKGKSTPKTPLDTRTFIHRIDN